MATGLHGVRHGRRSGPISSSAVRRVLELTGIDRVIDTYPDLDAAMAGRADTGR